MISWAFGACCRITARSAVGLITPHAALLAVQQIGQHRAAGDIGWGGSHCRMDQLAAAVDANMRLHAEIPLVALLRLMHLGITGLRRVFGGRRRIDNRRIDDRAGGHLQSLRRQMPLHLVEQLPAQRLLQRFLSDPIAEAIANGARGAGLDRRRPRRGLIPAPAARAELHDGVSASSVTLTRPISA